MSTKLKYLALSLASLLTVGVAFYLGTRFGPQFSEETFNITLKGTLDLAYWGTAIGGLLAIPTLLMLFVAFFMQRKELRTTLKALELQKQESELNRKALDTQREEVLESRKVLEVQKIDSAFFNMLSMLEQIVSSMVFKLVDNFPVFNDGNEGQTYVYTGRDYINKALALLIEGHNATTIVRYDLQSDRFIEYFNTPVLTEGASNEKEPTGKSFTVDEIRERIGYEYDEFYREHQHNLGRYFRYVYNIMKFIIENQKLKKIGRDDVLKYMQLLQAQLSNDEMGLIFYNAAFSEHSKTKSGRQRFKKWLDDYNILENIDESCLLEREHHWFYPKTDFKLLSKEERHLKKRYRVRMQSSKQLNAARIVIVNGETKAIEP